MSQTIDPLSDAAHGSDTTFGVLVRTFGLTRRVMEPHFARFGISGSQWAVLCAVHRAEGGSLKLCELGDRVLVRPPSVTGVVDRLHKMGLIDREPSRDDARAKEVSLTPAGTALVDRVLVDMPGQVESILADLSEADRRELRRLLGILSSRLETLASDDAKVSSL